jgi:NAD(P)-dependent dehydrogenase (short-subunit alcohol dehydrogenase family)
MSIKIKGVNMNDLFDLSGKVALVVGGTGQIGRALSVGLAQHGADIAIADSQLEPFKTISEKIGASGRQALAIQVDATDEQSVADMVNRVLEVFPRIDILMNLVGMAIRKPAETFPVDEWQKVIDANIRTTFLCCQAVGRVMIKQGGGKIINTSSVRGRYGLPEGYAGYCPGKGGVDTLTRTLACEWAKYNILVNAIAPAFVETERSSRMFAANPEFTKLVKSRIPLGRFAKLEELIGPVVFLASKASDFVTGLVLYVDGGTTTW